MRPVPVEGLPIGCGYIFCCRRSKDRVVAGEKIDKIINWPTFITSLRNRQMAQSYPEANFNRAVALIDSGSESELAEAKSILEQ
jgi:hypothetical protein